MRFASSTRIFSRRMSEASSASGSWRSTSTSRMGRGGGEALGRAMGSPTARAPGPRTVIRLKLRALSRRVESQPLYCAPMILRDPVHGLVAFERKEEEIVVKLLEAKELQRLRRIRQLGLASFAYPSADHTR